MTGYVVMPAAGPLPLLVAGLAAIAVLVWPGRHAHRRAVARALCRTASTREAPGGRSRRGPTATARAAARTVVRRGGRRASGVGALDHDLLVALVDAVAPGLEAGLGPGHAWRLAVTRTGLAGSAAGAGLAEAVAQAAAAGAPIGPVITAYARTVGSAPLSMLGLAWALSEETGAPMAATARTVARMLRADRAAARRLDAVAAESRTTARILTALPLSGPLFLSVLGLDPRRVAAGGPWIWLALAAGVALAVAGRMFLRRMADRVVRGPAIS